MRGKTPYHVYNFSELFIFFFRFTENNSQWIIPLFNSISVPLWPIKISAFPNCILAFLLDFITTDFSIFFFIK